MKSGRSIAAACLLLSMAGSASAQQPFEGQDGKDVVYLPTPPALVEKMLDMAAVTPADYVIDLGSGDGRIVIAAAKRGARALGVEYDAGLVALATRRAADAGVADKASFVQADLFQTDFSHATVLTMFLLSDIMLKIQPQIAAMKPGTRVVSNSFEMDGWAPDDSQHLAACNTWCTAHVWIVPANVDGQWRLPQGELALKQTFQDLSGTLTADGNAVAITAARMRGDQIGFDVGDDRYTGRVTGDRIEGRATSGQSSRDWTATRIRQ
jgi:SAM-dependent methyltransferase